MLDEFLVRRDCYLSAPLLAHPAFADLDPLEIPQLSLDPSLERYAVAPWDDFLYADVLRVQVRGNVYVLCGEPAAPDEPGVPAALVDENPFIIDTAGEDTSSVVETRDSYRGEIILADQGDIVVPAPMVGQGFSHLLLREDPAGNASILDGFRLSTLRYFVVQVADAVDSPLSLCEAYLS